jgi:hypothetical protein
VSHIASPFVRLRHRIMTRSRLCFRRESLAVGVLGAVVIYAASWVYFVHLIRVHSIAREDVSAAIAFWLVFGWVILAFICWIVALTVFATVVPIGVGFYYFALGAWYFARGLRHVVRTVYTEAMRILLGVNHPMNRPRLETSQDWDEDEDWDDILD